MRRNALQACGPLGDGLRGRALENIEIIGLFIQINAGTHASAKLGRVEVNVLTNDEQSYHLLRAEAEMVLARTAETKAAAAAHLKLSELHMDRIRIWDDSCEGAAVSRSR
jgi:hypothetical protein